MNPKSSKNCIICSSKNSRIIFSYNEPDKYEVAAGVSKAGYFRRWVQCKQCGFYYSVYSRDKNCIGKIYSSMFYDSPEEIFKRVTLLPEAESETKFRVNWIKKNINNIWRQGLLRRDNPPCNMLDIGGGTGIFAYEFQDDDWVSHVIDPNKNSRFIETKLHINFVQGYYKPDSFNCKFHLITLNYLLEHYLDPISLLENLHRDMTKNSLLFVEVPDAAFFQDEAQDHYIFNSPHLWMFSPKTLKLLLDHCGFKIYNLHQMKTVRGNYALLILAGEKA